MTEKNHPAPRSPRPSSGARGHKGKPKGRGKRILYGFLRFVAVMMCLGIMAVSVGGVLLSLYVVNATKNDGELLNLEELKLSYTSVVMYEDVDEDGKPVWKEYQRLDTTEENRVWVEYGDICSNLVNAFVAIEDQDFWTHGGFNLKRTIYAALNELSYALTGSYIRGTQQGASTINQQLIKNITDDDESEGTAGYLRKIREIFRAMSLNSRYSKEMIMEAYLNTLSLTGNIGGVQAGANQYFGKDVGYNEDGTPQLTLAQCATIAAITKNPTQYSPISNPEMHLVRRNKVLTNMYEQGYIVDENGNPDEEALNAALAEPLTLVEAVRDENAAVQTNNSYFTDALLEELVQDMLEQNPYGREDYTEAEALNDIYTKGLRIFSTVQPDVQSAMEGVFNRGDDYWVRHPIEDWVPENAAEGTEPRTIQTQAAGAVLNYDGELVACVGGLGAKTLDRGLNRAVDMERQVGSTMKGVAAYPLAIDYGVAYFSKLVVDAPFKTITENGRERAWPRNYGGAGGKGDMMTVYEAVKQSYNTVAVRVGSYVGAREMYDFVTETLGIQLAESDMDYAPLVLGATTTGMSPYDLAAAYMMYGSGGKYTTPHTYTTVEDYKGNVILKKEITTVQAIGEDTAYVMNRLLKGVLYDAGGTVRGMAANEAGMESVGKTGTTNETKDVWFVGLTPYFVSAFWYGYDENVEMESWYSAAPTRHPGAKAWRDIMNTVQADEEKYPYKEWEMPDSVLPSQWCTATGKIATDSCPRSGTVGYYSKRYINDEEGHITYCDGNHGTTEPTA